MSELSDKYEPKATYYKVGTMRSPYPDAPVYLAIIKNLLTFHTSKSSSEVTEKDISYDGEIASLFIKTPDNKFIVTNDYQNDQILCQSACQYGQVPLGNESIGIMYKHDLSLDRVGSVGDVFQGYDEYLKNETGMEFRVQRTNHFFDPSGMFLVKEFGSKYALYSNQDIKSNIVRLKNIIQPTFAIKLPTGLLADVYQGRGASANRIIYKKGVDEDPTYDPVITWTALEKPLPLPTEPPDKGIDIDYTSIAYTPNFDGCKGNMEIDSIVSEGEFLDVKNDLIQVGTTNGGDIVYELKNKNFKIFEEFWSERVSGFLSFAEYSSLKPILILMNKLGIYRMIFREDLVNSKCWAEPIIYLYPEKPINVTLKLDRVINLTKSDPAYHNTWNLIAHPNGEIYLPISQKKYPYLFWEGSAPIPSSPIAKDIVRQTEVHDYLENTLTKLGLSDKEKQDFERYWEAQLNNGPYYLISFYDAKQIDQVIPLHVNPKPDTVIRILMTYKRLKGKPTRFSPIRLDNYQTPQRNGFVLVEWGGIAHTLDYEYISTHR